MIGSEEDRRHLTEDGTARRNPDETMRFDISSPPRARVDRRKLGDEDHMTDDEESRPRKSLRPRSPTDSMGTDVHSDIAIDDDVTIDGLNLEDRRILSSVILGVDITEVFSPARVAQVARKFGLTPGSSMDLTGGWTSISRSTGTLRGKGSGTSSRSL